MHKKMIAVLIGLILLLGGGLARAGETVTKGTDAKKGLPPLDNIGFMKNPPKELKEKFPMCDAFLKVEWIDKVKKIGYSRYDLYQDGKKEKQKAFALIHIDESHPHFDYDLSVFQGKGKIGTKKVFSIIRDGKVFFNTNYLSIEYGNDEKRLDFDFTIADTRGVQNFTLADCRRNVCIFYPDNQRVWIAEGKQIDKMYSKEEVVKIVAKIKMYVPSSFPLDIWNIWESWIIDLNYDGREDYVSRGKVVYSYGSKYHDMKALWDERELSDTYGHWSFPPTQRKCELKDQKEWVGGFFLTTDGKNYFLNNKCNLTELTQGGK